MNEIYDKLKKCTDVCRSITDFKPRVALVLGSGLGQLADEIQIVKTIEYKDIEGFPLSTVQGHRGRFVFGKIGETPVVIMQGRVHYYEGYLMSDVVLGVRIMRMLGAENLFLTNAAGGINRSFQPGTLMMITDQISSFFPSPLIGANIEELGTRFPDMSRIYDSGLQSMIYETAEQMNIPLQKGIYLQFSGPAYETPAEINMAEALGADACGMSTACEAVAAKHMGMKICGISCITNMASGRSEGPLSHDEVQTTADLTADRFKQLIKSCIMRM